MQTAIHRLLVLMLLAGPGCAGAFADGGQVRASEQFGEYQLTVFTAPNPLRAGPVDVSVLLQHASSGTPASEATVTVELTPVDQSLPPIRATATTAAATNKLLRSTLVELPAAGTWNVRVACQPANNTQPLAVNFAMEAAPPLPAWLSVWPWFSWPVVVVILFVVHRMLVFRRQSRRPVGAPSRVSQSMQKAPRGSDSALQILTRSAS